MARVLVLCDDFVPVDGRAASGAGLRAWGLGEGLRSAGHDVTFAMTASFADRWDRPPEGIAFFDPATLDRFLDAEDPDVAVYQHWPLASLVRREHRARTVIDFHGPLLLETLHREPDRVGPLVDAKLHALARADYFTCASSGQLHYYAAYLLLAGFDLRELPLAVIPFSMPPDLPEHREWPAPPIFVYGGAFLPWQDPTLGLRVLVEELEATGRGVLRTYGGAHPSTGHAEERWEELRPVLERSGRVEATPTVPRAELIEHYARASVAWDLMARNIERELAFTSRTVEYLWCGLPVVYNDYSELADYIGRADAGWTIDPADEEAIRAVVRAILADPEEVRRKGENGRRLVRGELTWDRTIGPLDAYCRDPRAARRLERPWSASRDGAPDLSGVDALVVSEEMAVLLARLRAAVPAPAKRVGKRVLRALAARSAERSRR